VKAKAKSSSTPHPVWIQGEYITEPPERPADGGKRPAGHYIDSGGCPGANVYEISVETLCMDTGAVDCHKCGIYEGDILLYETEKEIGYFVTQDMQTAVDIITGEILGIRDLQAEDIKVIGNITDFPDFADGIRYCVENRKKIPYLPALSVLKTPYPFLKLTCLKCGHTTLSCSYMARHRDCGGYFAADFATKVYRKGTEKEKASA